ncbi:MAG: hypothetical protein AAGF87_01595 [Bacteroidota bacterium]
MNRRITFTFAILLATLNLAAQAYSFTGFVGRGDYAYDNQDYFSAFKYYEAALKFEDDLETQYKMGVAAFEARAYPTAQTALQAVASTEEANSYPLSYYYMGLIAQRQQQYEAATNLLEQFLAQYPDADPEYRQRAEQRLVDISWADSQEADTYDPQLQHMGGTINTEYSDFGYTVSPAGLVYYSTHSTHWRRDTIRPKRTLSRIRSISDRNSTMPLPELINLDNENVAHSAFTPDGKTVFYSICGYRDENGGFDKVICDLYKAKVGEDGRWTFPEALDINMRGYSTAMPSVGTDIQDGVDYLYFASDRPGGMGDMDLYRAPLNEEHVPGPPENLTSINTSGQEVSPFFYSPRQTLFFATDGRFSFGGLDIHKSVRLEEGFSRPLNMGTPVNTGYEDLYYSQFPNQEKAYLASNRPSAEAIFYDEDNKICCYDLYKFVPDNRIDLLALTYDLLLDEDLAGATVALYEITPSGPVLVSEKINMEGNDFNWKLDPGKVYELRASKDGYTGVIDRFDLNDPELASLGLIVRPLYLNQRVMLDVYTFNQGNNEELPNTRVSLYEVAEGGSETLIATDIDPLSNQVEFPLDIGKRYIVRAERDDFGVSTEEEIDLREFRPQGSTRMRRDLYLGQLLQVLVIDGLTGEPLPGATVSLSQLGGGAIGTRTNETGNDFEFVVSLDRFFLLDTRRVDYIPNPRIDTLTFDQADLELGNGVLVFEVPLFYGNICDLLPLQVYFDNDHPNPNTTRRTTNLAYDETYYRYEGREQVFIDSFTMGLSEEDAFETVTRVENFFDDQLRSGFNRLEILSELLLAHLDAGNEFSLTLEGFTSPRAPTEYNVYLSSRRNNSIINYFKRWRNGALARYIDTGKLDFPDPTDHGENGPGEAPVSDRYDDPRESVYSIVASIRRRVDIDSDCDATSLSEENR